jgi:hypothetical protein
MIMRTQYNIVFSLICKKLQHLRLRSCLDLVPSWISGNQPLPVSL